MAELAKEFPDVPRENLRAMKAVCDWESSLQYLLDKDIGFRASMMKDIAVEQRTRAFKHERVRAALGDRDYARLWHAENRLNASDYAVSVRSHDILSAIAGEIRRQLSKNTAADEPGSPTESADRPAEQRHVKLLVSVGRQKDWSSAQDICGAAGCSERLFRDFRKRHPGYYEEKRDPDDPRRKLFRLVGDFRSDPAG